MAVDKLVDSAQLDADLTSVADAIRTKGGTSASLAFPAGFVSAIGDISAGGGYTADEVAEHTLSGAITITATTIAPGAFWNATGLTSIIAPNATHAGTYAFYNCNHVTSCSFPKLQTVRHRAFNAFGTEGMSLFLPELTACQTTSDATGSGGTSACAFASIKVSYLILPKLSTSTSYFASGPAILGVDFSAVKSFSNNMFNNASNLTTVIIRRTTLTSLDNVGAFVNTPFASGKAGGTLYVPASLVSSYQSATNWSTILGYGSGAQNQILPIEGSIYENSYVDGSPIT